MTMAACAATPAMRAAEGGDRGALRAALAKLSKRGGLSNCEAASLAATVAARDLRVAPAPEAALRVRDLRSCAHEVDDALAERARTHDAAGAQSALARLESGRLDLGSAREWVNDPIAEWRAVGARGLVRREDRDVRVRSFLDPEPDVRRSAVRAARDAADPADLDALAEAARLDPQPIIRTEAVRAMGALPPAPGHRVALLLRDLWTVGDSGLREAIARAWASSSIWPSGGREALRVVLASDHGPGVVEAAGAVLGRLDAGPELETLAASALARSIATGTRSLRLQALVQARLEVAGLRAAVESAAGDDDLEVRVAALGRLAEHDPVAVKELEDLAQPGAPAGASARLALADAGDRRVQAWLENDLAAPAPQDRVRAAAALATLGVAARGAPLLADDDPSVRTRAACVLVTAPSRVARR
jgi:hypothetical protein